MLAASNTHVLPIVVLMIEGGLNDGTMEVGDEVVLHEEDVI